MLRPMRRAAKQCYALCDTRKYLTRVTQKVNATRGNACNDVILHRTKPSSFFTTVDHHSSHLQALSWNSATQVVRNTVIFGPEQPEIKQNTGQWVLFPECSQDLFAA